MMYIPAFDPYAACYRMLHLLDRLGAERPVEADRLRILDFYLLFPARVYGIRLRRSESDLRALRRQWVARCDSPYSAVTNERRLFERMRPYQTIALHRLAACGLVSAPHLLRDQVLVPDPSRLRQVTDSLVPLPEQGCRVVDWLCHCFRTTPLSGEYGLKYRTQLIEYRYDGK